MLGSIEITKAKYKLNEEFRLYMIKLITFKDKSERVKTTYENKLKKRINMSEQHFNKHIVNIIDF